MASRIVVPLDLSGASRRALAVAGTLASQIGAAVDAMIVMEGRYPDVDRAEAAAMAAAAECPLNDVVVFESGHVPGALVELAADPDVLLCLGSHGRSAVGELIVGSVSATVVRQATRPVLLVGPNGPERAPAPFRHLVIGIDGEGPDSLRLVPVAAEWAAWGLQPWLVEAVTYRESETAPPDVNEVAALREVARALRERDVVAEWEVLHSPQPDSHRVARTIVDFGDKLGDPIGMVAIHGRSGLRRLALGSVSLGIVHRASWPVLIVPPP